MLKNKIYAKAQINFKFYISKNVYQFMNNELKKIIEKFEKNKEAGEKKEVQNKRKPMANTVGDTA